MLHPHEAQVFKIERPVLTQQDLYALGGNQIQQTSSNGLSRMAHRLCKETRRFCLPEFLHKPKNSKNQSNTVNCKSFCRWFASFFPFIAILRKYDFKGWFINDLVAGITVGIMHVPQGMAYAMLATLPPVYGLYTSLFPPLIYFFFGTSRHISIGTIAVVSLLTGEILDKKVMSSNPYASNVNVTDFVNSTNAEFADPSVNIRILYAPALAALVGITQLIMGFLRLGGLTRYLSGPMTSGFTVGIAVHVFTSQVKTLLGVSTPKPSGLFAVPKLYYGVFRDIGTINWATFILSSICIIILAVFKILISPMLMRKIKIPFPIDLLVVILSTVTSHYMKLNQEYQVNILGTVSKGIPPPRLPMLSGMGDLVADIIVLAVVAFSVTISLSRIFAKTYEYNVDCNQELIAYGLSNVLSSVFHAFPSASSLSRSTIQASAGGKTQVTTIFSCVLLVLVLYLIGPLFYSVPNCCLSAIIVVALRGMFLHAKEVKLLWNYSIWDFYVWVLTCLVTIIFDVKFGLLSGVLFSALTIILRSQSPQVHILARVSDTEFYRSIPNTEPNSEVQVLVIRYDGGLYYANADHFQNAVYTITGLDPTRVYSRMMKVQRKLKKIENQLVTGSANCSDVANCNNEARLNSTAVPTETSIAGLDESYHTQQFINKQNYQLKKRRDSLVKRMAVLNNQCMLQHIILDCSTWGLVDIVGAEKLQQVILEYRKVDVSVSLAAVSDNVFSALQGSGKFPTDVQMFPSIHDAYICITGQIKDHPNHLNCFLDNSGIANLNGAAVVSGIAQSAECKLTISDKSTQA